MKIKDLKGLNDITEDECGLCAIHELADKQILPSISCPYCEQLNHHVRFNERDFIVVGESNTSDEEENIGKFISFRCIECGEYIALMPVKINWNANHDIYYTGGKHYLNDDDEHAIFMDCQKEMQRLISEWWGRIKNGEPLQEWNLALWIKRRITESIAKYLYEKGLKK